MGLQTRRVITALGLLLVLAVFSLIAVFVVKYVQQERVDREVLRELEEKWRNRPLDMDLVPSYNPGELVGRIIIPRISLDSPVVEMAHVDDLASLDLAPAHLAGTPLPGQNANFVISGHRVTHNHPFLHLDQLSTGDQIILMDHWENRFYYLVDRIFTVNPNDTSVLENTEEATLTLITCHPPHSARLRLVVKATLVKEIRGPVNY